RFRRSALTLEEAAGDAPRSREFFLVVDGQREEILPRLDRLCRGDGAEDNGFAKGRENRAVGLAGNAARFELEGLSTPLDFDCFRIEHVFSFTPRPDAGGDSNRRTVRSLSGSGRLWPPLRPAGLRGFRLANGPEV